MIADRDKKIENKTCFYFKMEIKFTVFDADHTLILTVFDLLPCLARKLSKTLCSTEIELN